MINSKISFKGTYFDKNNDLQYTTPQEDEKKLYNIYIKAQSIPADSIEISINKFKNVQMVLKEEKKDPLTFVLMGTGLLIEDAIKTIDISFDELSPKATKTLERLKELLQDAVPELYTKYEEETSKTSDSAFQLEDALNRNTIEHVKKVLNKE